MDLDPRGNIPNMNIQTPIIIHETFVNSKMKIVEMKVLVNP